MSIKIHVSCTKDEEKLYVFQFLKPLIQSLGAKTKFKEEGKYSHIYITKH